MRVHLITPVITEGIRTLDDVAPLMRDDLVITQSLLATGPASIECEFDEAMAVPGLVVALRLVVGAGVTAPVACARRASVGPPNGMYADARVFVPPIEYGPSELATLDRRGVACAVLLPRGDDDGG